MVISGYYGRSRKIVTVIKVTATGQITCSDNSRWTSRGRQVGDSDTWSRIYIKAADEATIKAVGEEQERHALAEGLNSLHRRDWSKAPIEEVRKLAGAIYGALGADT